MANNVYVGQRYVPIFANPVEWSSAQAYEPLTIVTYQGASYTSKCYVPSGVSLTNTDYWIVTGNYNAQVDAYREETQSLGVAVGDLQTRISSTENGIASVNTQLGNLNLKGKVAHFFGDSLTYGLLYASNSKSAYNYPSTFGKITGATVYNHAISGTTACEIDNTKPFLSAQLQSTSLADADYVFIQIGANDFGTGSPIGKITDDKKHFKGALYQCYNYIVANAKFGCKVIALSMFPQPLYFTNGSNFMKNTIIDYNNAIIDVANECNIGVINVLDTVGVNIFNYNNNSLLDTSGHFTDKGYEMIGRSIAQVMSNGYSMKPVYNAENILKSDDFSNEYGGVTYFPNGNSDIMLLLKSAKYSLVTYNLRKGYHTFSCDIYNGNDVATTTGSNNYYISVRLIKNLGLSNQEIVEVTRLSAPSKGATHYCSTFYVDTKYPYTFYLIPVNDNGLVSDVYCTNLCLCEGKYEGKPKTVKNRVVTQSAFGSNVVQVGNQPVRASISDGILRIGGQIGITGAKNMGDLLVTLNSFGAPFGDNNTAQWYVGVDTVGFKPVLLYLSGNEIHAGQNIASGVNVVVSGCVPIKL